jgi:uncharacterized protein YecE (DUF72 family)
MGNLHVGTIGWSYSFWKGNFYPSKLASKGFLAYYSTKFNTVEVDSTFYRIPNQQTITNWKEQTPEGFLFSLKFPRIITHIKMLNDCEDETNAFLGKVAMLKEKLGCLLLQFPPAFGIEKFSLLSDFLENLPKEHHYVVEIRNKELLNEGLYSLLKNQNATLAWIDSPIMPQTDIVTSDFLYVRWEGDRRKVKGVLGKIEVNKEANTRLWANKITPFLGKQMEVFGYFGKYYSGYPPSDTNSLLSLLT